jgi:hypothetical protein
MTHIFAGMLTLSVVRCSRSSVGKYTQNNKRARSRVASSATKSDNPMLSMFMGEEIGMQYKDALPNNGATLPGLSIPFEADEQRRLTHEDGFNEKTIFGELKPGNHLVPIGYYMNVYTSDCVVKNMQRIKTLLTENPTVSDDDFDLMGIFGSYILNKEGILAALNSGLSFPFEFLVARPFIQHQAYSLIITKGGGETGATYFGHNNVTLGDDAVSKLHYANLTFYQKSIIHNPKNVYIAEDVYLTGYCGGNSMGIFEDKTDLEAGANLQDNTDNAQYQKSIFVMLMQVRHSGFFFFSRYSCPLNFGRTKLIFFCIGWRDSAAPKPRGHNRALP